MIDSVAEMYDRLPPKKRALISAQLAKNRSMDGKQSALTRHSNAASYPLSFAQEALWFLHQLAPESTAYNEHLMVEVVGPLNAEILGSALKEIVRRHEALRTGIKIINGAPRQVVCSEGSFQMCVIDLSEIADSHVDRTVLELSRESVRQPFQVDNAGSLVRVYLLRVSEGRHFLLIAAHHLVADQWSISVFFRELTMLYEAFAAGKPSPLNDLRVQYGDFAVWQRECVEADVKSQLSYWKQELAGAPSLIKLPTDHARPAVQKFSGALESITIPKDLCAKLEQFSREQGASLFMTLLSVFVAVLGRYSGEDDILVNSPVAGRRQRELEELIGLFINNIVLRAHILPNMTFRDLLKQVQSTALRAYANQDIPFEKIVEMLQPARSLSHSPISQVIFAFQNIRMYSMRIGDTQLRPAGIGELTTKTDILLRMGKLNEELVGVCTYDTELFEKGTIERFLQHFVRLLEGVVEGAEQKVSELPLMSEEEERRIVAEWNATGVEYEAEGSLHELFEEQVEKTPEAIAVSYEEEQVSYAELNRRANQLGGYLRKMGVGPEVRVGICVERSVELVVGILGVLKAGGAYVPLDPEYPQQRLAFMLEDSQVAVLLTTEELEQKLPSSWVQVVCMDRDEEGIGCESGSPLPHLGVSSQNTAYVIYTSGSTGQPKGVMVTHSGMSNYLRWAVTAYRGEEVMRAPVHSSTGFDLTVTSLFAPLLSGGTVLLVAEDRADVALSTAFNTEEFNLIKVTPAHLDLLASSIAGDQLAQARTLIVGGEALQAESLSMWRTHAPNTKIVNEYGPTETVVGCSAYEIGSLQMSGSVPIGRPVANTQIYILDENLRAVPVGVAGELYIGGVQVARGYLNRPDLTAERFIPDGYGSREGGRLYKTGDLGRYLEDGNIEYLGRGDDQVKVRGYRIELGEIEAQLREHREIKEAVVMAREDTPGDKRLVAYVTGVDEKGPNVEELRGHLKAKLPEYMVPSVFVVLESIPLTANGKVDRKALRSLRINAQPPAEPFAAPQTPNETELAKIWREILVAEYIRIDDNFFGLGGSSLQVIQVISRIRRIFDVSMPVDKFFDNPTIKEMALLITQMQVEQAGEDALGQIISEVSNEALQGTIGHN